MTLPRFSVGIDLGTTNSALAFVALDRDVASEMLVIPQLESPISIVEAPTLPSFLYLPEDSEAAAVVSDAAPAVADAAPAVSDAAGTAVSDDDARDEAWVIGRFARAKAAETPGRVVHSAKSWLCHHSADRSAPFLPWGSDDIAGDRKISPVRASALLLRYLRDAWNDRFAGDGADFAFDAQIVTITVPASFDAAAQRLTVAAAQMAGYPETVRLLEEPQAALYRWLEQHDTTQVRRAALHATGAEPRHVLVVDIGGGTSDFSLFEFRPNDTGTDAHIKRIAVSEHILLGGDNMDLALAHKLEAQLSDGGEELAARQWANLVARCRDVKETALSTDGSPEETFSVSIPGRGSSLIAGVRSAQLARAEIERLLLGGFFPECYADEGPIRTKAALRELGLPYARDPAVTRHLADFLRDRPAIDAVLFNGGSLRPRRLRQRISSEIGKWQSGVAPIVLENPEPDFAVARGAARFGKIVYTRAERIEAATAHAIFLQAHRTTDPAADERGASSLVCVLPKGAPTERTFAIANLALELRVNRPVRFQTYSSARDGVERAGDVVAWNDRDFHALPPLETSVQAGDSGGAARSGAGPRAALHQTVPVTLTARLSELGRLEISCVSADPDIRGSWPLEFNLRRPEMNASAHRGSTTVDAPVEAGPGVVADVLDAARVRIATLFERPFNNRDKLTATRLIKSLEMILGTPKSEWNVVLVRSLWATLERCMAYREKSLDHEEAWLILAGFLLRPGFGAAMDDVRIDRLWTLRETGLCFAAKTVKIAEYVLWRRVAGGLSTERQERVLAPELTKLREQRSPPPELVLLAGNLERIDRALKTELIDRFIDTSSTLEREKKHNAHFLAALGFLLNRAPLYGGPETVVSPDLVQRAFEAFSRFEWDGPRRIELQALFLRAARVVDNRSIDVSRSLRNRIADKLEKSGLPPSKTAPLRDYLPLQRSERAGSFGESLPPGLILRETIRPMTTARL